MHTFAAVLILAGLSSATDGPLFQILAVDADRGILFSVCDTQFDDEPRWINPEVTLPPLTISVAIRKATEALSTYVDDPTIWTLTNVNARHVRDDRWAYIVSFFSRGEDLEIPVLFSGAVVKGQSHEVLATRGCPSPASPSN